MRKYYIVENNQQAGPLSKEELRGKRINPSSLIWFEGMANWEPASSINELNDLFMATPPPPPPFHQTPSAPPAFNYAPVGGNGQSHEQYSQKTYYRIQDAGNSGGGLIAVAYLLAILGGIGGIITGSILWMAKEKTDGEKLKKYTPTTQLHGAFAFFLGIICWAICVEMFLKA